MMRRAGFLQMNRKIALDDHGIPWKVVELRIGGSRFGIRMRELTEALTNGNRFARVEVLGQHWQQILGGTAGIARRSLSGKALNVELMTGEKFTLSLDSVSAVLSGRSRFAYIAAIPARSTEQQAGNRRITDYEYHPGELATAPVAG